MTTLPITHMTPYKHGVGFFTRRAKLSGEEVRLSFRVEEMNDILKSLTAIDWSGGRVLGIDYATPQSREERLAGCTITARWPFPCRPSALRQRWTSAGGCRCRRRSG